MGGYGGIPAYEVVGYMCEDGPVCIDCGVDSGVAPIFAGSEEAEDRCVDCEEWLLGEEPEYLVRERQREEEEAAEAENAKVEARAAQELEALMADAEEDIEEAEALKRKALLKIELLKAKKENK